MLRQRMTLLVAIAIFSTSAGAATIADSILAPADQRFDQWWSQSKRDALDGPAKAGGTALVPALNDALAQTTASVPAGSCDTAAPAPDIGRACTFIRDLRTLIDYFATDASCLSAPVLERVTSASKSSATDINKELTGAQTTGAAARAVAQSRDNFTPLTVDVGGVYPLFENGTLPLLCTGGTARSLQAIRVPADGTARTDKLIIGQAYVLSLITAEKNRPYALATAAQIKLADTRWKNFEANVLHDQFPWETLIFNDWLAPNSPAFRGTLTHPPTLQIRAIHPVPTGILDVSGGDHLFRPRVTIEVLGLRALDPDDEYKPLRAISAIATLKAESNESNGYGLLYVWKRGSVGIIRQKRDGDHVIGVVFGIDLANQIQSRRNTLMAEWQALRDQLAMMQAP